MSSRVGAHSRVDKHCAPRLRPERHRGSGVRLRHAVVVALLSSLSALATPKIVRVDGSIFDSSGSPTTGSKDIQIKAYDAASGGSLLWTSSTYNTTVSSGRFTISMDASTGSPSLVDRIGARASAEAIYFQIEVDSDAANGSMTTPIAVVPRIRAKGTAFALNSAAADSLAGVTATTVEFNFLSGVTAALQSQLNAIAPMALAGITASTAGSVNTGYINIGASLVGVTLPSTCAAGDRLGISGVSGTGGWKLYVRSGQTIYYSGAGSSANAGSATTASTGYLKSIDVAASAQLRCLDSSYWQIITSDGLYTGDYLAGVSTYTSSTTFTVPANVVQLTLKAWGGGGGGGGGPATSNSGGAGGGGAYATRVVRVTPGEVLRVSVGGAGAAGTHAGSTGGGGGGGGASGVFRQAFPLVIAGGGGGGGGGGVSSSTGGAGGAGGFTNGVAGTDGASSTNGKGGGGTQVDGGSRGAAGASWTAGFRGQASLGAAGADNASTAGGVGGAGATGGGGTGGTATNGWGGAGGGGGGGFFGGGSGSTGNSGSYGGSGGGGGSSSGDSGNDGSGTSAGNNSDSDYAGSAGAGGAGGSAGASGSAGTAGRVVIKF